MQVMAVVLLLNGTGTLYNANRKKELRMLNSKIIRKLIIAIMLIILLLSTLAYWYWDNGIIVVALEGFAYILLIQIYKHYEAMYKKINS